MDPIRSERGFALILVLLMCLILSATVITISASLRSQANTVAMSDKSTEAMQVAEDGLSMAVADMRANGIPTNNIGYTINYPNSWTIRINYNAATNVLTSTAINNKGYSRSVQLTASTGKGVEISLNHSFFAGTEIQTIGQGGNEGLTININNGNDFYAGEKIDLRNPNATVHFNGGDLYTPGTISTNENEKEGNGTTFNTGCSAEKFPEIDIANISATTTCNNKNEFFSKFNDLVTNGGGVLVVNISKSDLDVDGDYTLNFPTSGNTSLICNDPKNVVVVFRKDESFAESDTYTVTLNGSSGSGIKGNISILSDGSIHYAKINDMNMNGITYALGDIHVNNIDGLRTPGFVARKKILIDNCTNNIDFLDRNKALDLLKKATQTKVTTGSWREL